MKDSNGEANLAITSSCSVALLTFNIKFVNIKFVKFIDISFKTKFIHIFYLVNCSHSSSELFTFNIFAMKEIYPCNEKRLW
jgi:hypothetical protein